MDKDESNTTQTDVPGTTIKKYGPCGNVQKEYNHDTSEREFFRMNSQIIYMTINLILIIPLVEEIGNQEEVRAVVDYIEGTSRRNKYLSMKSKVQILISLFNLNTISFHLIMLLLCSCNNRNDKSTKVINKGDSLLKKITMNSASQLKANRIDTASFTSNFEKGVSLFALDDHRNIELNDKRISISLNENKKGSYDLVIKTDSTLIFGKKNIDGISKIFYDGTFLLFSMYTFHNEDGANEGVAVVMQMNGFRIRQYHEKLSNTCNPVVFNNKFYFVSDLNLIEADSSLNFSKSLSIKYQGANESDEYLDTYQICGLSVTKQNSKLAIEFTPNKSDLNCRFYVGALRMKDSLILLKK